MKRMWRLLLLGWIQDSGEQPGHSAHADEMLRVHLLMTGRQEG
jgi:hypothetical protein